MTELNEQSSTGFKSVTEFCLYLENLKLEHNFDTYIETITWYSEYESDIEIDQLTKFLNRKILDNIEYEARVLNMLKDSEELCELF